MGNETGERAAQLPPPRCLPYQAIGSSASTGVAPHTSGAPAHVVGPPRQGTAHARVAPAGAGKTSLVSACVSGVGDSRGMAVIGQPEHVWSWSRWRRHANTKRAPATAAPAATRPKCRCRVRSVPDASCDRSCGLPRRTDRRRCAARRTLCRRSRRIYCRAILGTAGLGPRLAPGGCPTRSPLRYGAPCRGRGEPDPAQLRTGHARGRGRIGQ